MKLMQRDITMVNGPPWGFRLFDDPQKGLIVCKVRQNSPAESSGLMENDQLFAINGIQTSRISHAQAVQIIDYASYLLTLTIQRPEKEKKVNTFFLDTSAYRRNQPDEDVTKTELQLMWEKENTPPRRTPTPPREPLIRTYDPDVTPVSMKSLLTEYQAPKIDKNLKKKPFSDSTFYSSDRNYYPTIEEQIAMCKKVADSLEHPVNQFSEGAKMFFRQKNRIEKYVKEGPDPIPDPYENPPPSISSLRPERQATPEQLAQMEPPPPPPPLPPVAPSYPGLIPAWKKGAIPVPPPPPLAPGQPKTIQEYMEKLNKFPKVQHTSVDPQKCFDIASALHGSNSRGAKLFAKRKARAAKFEIESQGSAMEDEVQQSYPVPTMVKPKLESKLAESRPIKIMPNRPSAPMKISSSRTSINQEPPSTAQVFASNQKFFADESGGNSRLTTPRGSIDNINTMPDYKVNSYSSLATNSTTKTWKPVKFNIPAN